MKEPQLSAEMIEELKSYVTPMHPAMFKGLCTFIATALEEQKQKTLTEVEGLLVDEPEHFSSSKNPENMGKNNLKAQIRNKYRAELRAKLAEMKEGKL